MFTGLVEEVGEIAAIAATSAGKELTVRADKIIAELTLGASVAINGICLTVKFLTPKTFQVDVVQETLTRTNIGSARPGTRVNLEPALSFGGRLGGHLVQGHIDCLGAVIALERQAGEWILQVQLPENFAKYVVEKGSIAINGISLTVAACTGRQFQTAIIPHTWANTNLSLLKVGEQVNLEVDLIGKYIERLLGPYYKKTEGLTLDKLESFGY